MPSKNIALATNFDTGIGVFLTDHDAGSPSVFKHFVHKFESMHDISILLHVKRALRYTVSNADAHSIIHT